MKKYSIRETNLTNIGDALRTKLGDTKIIRVNELQQFPVVTVQKTSNATGFYSFEGKYNTYEEWDYTSNDGTFHYVVDVVRIPNASSIKVKYRHELAYSTDALDSLILAGAEVTDPIAFVQVPSSNKTGEHCMIADNCKEVTFENTDVVSIRIKVYDVNIEKSNILGYYAEVWGLDADGNPLETYEAEVEVEKEVPRTFSSAEMAEAIDMIPVPPDSVFKLTGDCSYRFYGGAWDWLIEQSDRMYTDGITVATNMFNGSTLERIPFDIIFNDLSNPSCKNMFTSCANLKEVPYFYGRIGSLSAMFSNCTALRELPEDWADTINWTYIQTNNYTNIDGIFEGCYSLRKVPDNFMSNLKGIQKSATYSWYKRTFCNCRSLDEINNLQVLLESATSNLFSTFENVTRLKKLTFATQEDGTPYSAAWKKQAIDLSKYVGYSDTYKKYITDYNSGITADKEVTDDTTYQALKNDPDWFTCNVSYSRFNHDSAVEFINSLPDVSSGSENTIKFTGAAGSLTDGGAINTLTEEEIAVAAARGWTVTFA